MRRGNAFHHGNPPKEYPVSAILTPATWTPATWTPADMDTGDIDAVDAGRLSSADTVAVVTEINTPVSQAGFRSGQK